MFVSGLVYGLNKTFIFNQKWCRTVFWKFLRWNIWRKIKICPQFQPYQLNKIRLLQVLRWCSGTRFEWIVSSSRIYMIFHWNASINEVRFCDLFQTLNYLQTACLGNRFRCQVNFAQCLRKFVIRDGLFEEFASRFSSSVEKIYNSFRSVFSASFFYSHFGEWKLFVAMEKRRNIFLQTALYQLSV